MNGFNGYQGQIRAIDQQSRKFTQGTDLFRLIENDAAVPVHSIIRLGIQDFPAPYVPIQPGTSRQNGFKVKISDQLNPIEKDLKTISIGFNSMYELDDVNIKFFKAVSDSSDRVIIDYIIQEGAS